MGAFFKIKLLQTKNEIDALGYALVNSGNLFGSPQDAQISKTHILLTLLFSSGVGCRKGGGQPSNECRELARGPLQHFIL